MWRHGSHSGVPQQRNGGHIGVPKPSTGNWTLFLCKHRVLFQKTNMAAGHVSENALYRKIPKISKSSQKFTSSLWMRPTQSLRSSWPAVLPECCTLSWWGGLRALVTLESSDLKCENVRSGWIARITVCSWGTAQLPLPKRNINTKFRFGQDVRFGGGVSGQFPRNIYWSNCAYLAFKGLNNKLLGILLPAVRVVFQTTQNWFCNGSFESLSFRQACSIRNEDSRYKIGYRSFSFLAGSAMYEHAMRLGQEVPGLDSLQKQVYITEV